MSEHEDREDRPVTLGTLDLMFKAFRRDMQLLVLGSVALNQFLSGIAVPSFVAAGGIVGLVAWKAATVFLAARG